MEKVTCKNLSLSYGEKMIVKNLNINIKKGKITTIIGPNGSGKSTILKAISKLLRPTCGNIYIDTNNIIDISNKDFAKELAMLLQKNTCPHDICVRDLLYYGRIPHKKWHQSRNKKDDEIIEKTMELTGIKWMQNKAISQLSGGESQRVWLAMALCQEPRVLLLDEPTTYLDISYQLELLELVKSLNRNKKLTVVMVLHDLNQASKYSDYLYVLKNGSIYSSGSPKEVITHKMLEEVYKIEADILKDEYNLPYIMPRKKIESKKIAI